MPSCSVHSKLNFSSITMGLGDHVVYENVHISMWDANRENVALMRFFSMQIG